MHEHVHRWLEYPFAVAGPAAVAFFSTAAVAASACALFVSRSVQLWVAIAVWFALTTVLQRARRRFARTRGIANVPSVLRVDSRRVSSAGFALGIGAVVAMRALGFGLAWAVDAIVVVQFSYEASRRRRWAKAGYPGDPRWRRRWEA